MCTYERTYVCTSYLTAQQLNRIGDKEVGFLEALHLMRYCVPTTAFFMIISTHYFQF